ncbi:MAG TPA: winged helix-turn-helix domain-containing protein [Vicinamibacterales bacterium]|nr:winged helix-turn-helix domain-containing protein [Vicinamibacterales bacterium]
MAGVPCFLFGDFEFDPGRFELRKGTDVQAVEPKALDVLRLLLERAPDVVEKDQIFSVVWKDVAVTDNALTRVIAQLRKALGDDARAPRYIATVSTRGYRMVAPVRHATSSDRALPSEAPVEPRDRGASTSLWHPGRRTALVVAGVTALAAAAGVAAWLALRAGLAGPNVSDRREMVSGATLDVATMAALTPSQVTTGRGFDGFLAYSFDGSSIAYSSDRSGSLEVYAEGLTPGSAATRLTTNGHQNVQPAWSPDGRLIAYHDMAENGIWVVPSRGGAARMVSPFGAHPSWSPDGRRLAFQSQAMTDLNPGGAFGATSTIWTIELGDRAEPVPLTRPGQPSGSHGMPAWWPEWPPRGVLGGDPGRRASDRGPLGRRGGRRRLAAADKR